MIGERIRKIRSVKGFSQDYVADLLNISQSAYSDIEKNKSKIDIKRLQKIADIFEVNIDDIISFDENQVFNNTFYEKSNGFFNVEKVITETFDKERISYQEQVKSLKEEIVYLRKKLDEKE